MMYKTGDIVYHENLVFSNNVKNEKRKRPCIVLFLAHHEEGTLVCTCPLTSRIETFNRHPEKYWLVPVSVKRYDKISFAELHSVVYCRINETNYTGVNISRDVVDNLIKKVITYMKQCKETEKDNKIIKTLEYILLFDELERREEQAQIKTREKVYKNKRM